MPPPPQVIPDPCRFTFLTSCPLFQQTSYGLESLTVLNTRKELQNIKKAIQTVVRKTNEEPLRNHDARHETGVTTNQKYSAINFKPLKCSASSFQTLLTVGNGSTIIHYSGHGTDDGKLMFEGPNGIAAPIKPELLKSVFESGGNQDDSDDDSINGMGFEEVRP